MNKNNFPIYLSFATIFGILIGTFFSGDSRGILLHRGSANEMKIRRLLDYIERDYVDNVNTDVLLDEAITQMLGKLDPHSVYIPKENLQAIQENMQGNFVGIGIQFRMIQDSITVIQPIEGGPSVKAGIKAGVKACSRQGQGGIKAGLKAFDSIGSIIPLIRSILCSRVLRDGP